MELSDAGFTLPPSGSKHLILMWMNTVEESEGLGTVILDGPGEWVFLLELMDTDYRGIPTTLASGLYLCEISLEYTLDEFGDEDDPVVQLLRHRRLSVPSRDELVEGHFDWVPGLRA